jgi:hypothetical protein
MALTSASNMVFKVVWDLCCKEDPNFGPHRNIWYQLQDKSGNPINEGWYSYEVTNALGSGMAQTTNIPGTSVTDPANKGGGIGDRALGIPSSDGFNDHLGVPTGTSIKGIRQQLGVSQINPTASTAQNGQLIPIQSASGSMHSENSISIYSNPLLTMVNGAGCRAFMTLFGSLTGGPR